MPFDKGHEICYVSYTAKQGDIPVILLHDYVEKIQYMEIEKNTR